MALFAVGAPRVLNVEAHPTRPQCVATCAFCDDHLALVTSTAVQIWGGGQVCVEPGEEAVCTALH